MKKLMMIVALAGAGFVAIGCGGGARVIEQDRSITTVDQIDIQDFNAAASSLTREMLNDPRFSATIERIKSSKPDGRLPLVKISRVKNDTMLKVDMRGWLVDPMEYELMKANLVDFYAEDAEAQQMAMAAGNAPKPDLVLFGTVRDLRSEAGSTRQASYAFHLKLADSTGVTIWQGQKLITKQGKRPAIGI